MPTIVVAWGQDLEPEVSSQLRVVLNRASTRNMDRDGERAPDQERQTPRSVRDLLTERVPSLYGLTVEVTLREFAAVGADAEERWLASRL